MKIILPPERKFKQPNTSDLFGNIWYTKNMIFDELGYAKLGSRSVQIASERTTADFDRVVNCGISAAGSVYIATTDTAYIAMITDQLLQVSQDIDIAVPAFSNNSWGQWYQNRWHVTTDTGVFYKRTDAVWVDTSIVLTTGVPHPQTYFRNKNVLAIGNGNQVKLYNSTYSNTVTIGIPTDFSVVGLDYSNSRIGIATKPSPTVQGQNQEAFFFISDGATVNPTAGYSVGSEIIMQVKAYKGSWVLLTRSGRLLYFNGGGFDELAVLPSYYLNVLWGDSYNMQIYGQSMQIDGLRIYFNFNGNMNVGDSQKQKYVENTPGGILCYDPNVGLYHRYSPSITKAVILTVANTDITVATSNFFQNTTVMPDTGNPIRFTNDSSDPIGGLISGTIYYIIKIDPSNFKLALTKQDALDGNFITITSTGSPTNTFMVLDLMDYGASYYDLGCSVDRFATNGFTYDDIIYGAVLETYDSSTTYSYLNITVPEFENRGYLVSAKFLSDDMTNTFLKLYLKHRPLAEGEYIIGKYKNQDVLGLPVATAQNNANNNCVWTSTTTFTTTTDLSGAKTYLDADEDNEIECELISGAGAGQMTRINEITLLGTTYTVTVEDALDGIATGRQSNAIFNNWKVMDIIDSTNAKGFWEFSVDQPSKWIKYKIELRGSPGITIEELQTTAEPQEQVDKD